MNSVKTGTLLDATNSKNVQLSRRKSSVQYSTKESFIRDGTGKGTFPCEMKILKLKILNLSKPRRLNSRHNPSQRLLQSLDGIILSDRLLGRIQCMSPLRKKLSSEPPRLDVAQLPLVGRSFSLNLTGSTPDLLLLRNAITSCESCSLVTFLLRLLRNLVRSPSAPFSLAKCSNISARRSFHYRQISSQT